VESESFVISSNDPPNITGGSGIFSEKEEVEWLISSLQNAWLAELASRSVR
jgi:hypothetical protein